MATTHAPRASSASVAGSGIAAAPGTLRPQWHGYGQSRIIDARGSVLTQVGDDLTEEIIYAELPLPAKASGADTAGKPAR